MTKKLGHQERSPKPTVRSRFQRDSRHLLPANMANNISFCKLCKFSYSYSILIFCKSAGFWLILLLQFIFSEMFKVWQQRADRKDLLWEEIPPKRLQLPTFFSCQAFTLVLSFISPLHGEQMDSHFSIWWYHKSVNLSLTEVLEARNQLIVLSLQKPDNSEEFCQAKMEENLWK